MPDAEFRQRCQQEQWLYLAALHRNANAVALLRSLGADVDIFGCCYLPDVALGLQLLQQEPSLTEASNTEGQTPLHVACQTGCFLLAERLIDIGADVNALDDRGRTPISAAAHGGPWKPSADQRIIDLLLSAGAKVDFWLAAEIGKKELLQQFLSERPTLLNRYDNAGHTALFHASKNNHFDCVQFLLQQHADPNAGENEDQTPLSTAALHLLSQQTDPAICEALISAGAQCDLHTAAALNDVNQLRTLIDNDPQSVLYRRHGMLPADYAAHCGHAQALQVLLEAGTPPDACDDHGYSLNSKCQHLPELAAVLQSFERA